MLHNNQQPVSLNPLEDLHVDDFSLVIIPVIILHPHFTLCFFVMYSCFELKPKTYLCEWKTDTLKNQRQ